MPYIVRKKIQEANKNSIVLQLALDKDEKICKYYDLDNGIETYFRSSTTLIVDGNNCIKRVINKPFDFRFMSQGWYTCGNNNDVIYHRLLLLPQNFVRDYAIDSTMGLELEINEIIIKIPQGMRPDIVTESYKIFAEERVEGSMDFEIKGTSGELVYSSELLLNTMFEDKFFEALKLEINSSFHVGLYTATMVLVRKLFERQIIDLLRQKYGMNRKELFYSDGFLNLSELIRNLRDKLEDFKPYDFFKLEKEKQSFVDFLWNVREEGNAGAHSIEPSLGYKEITELKPSINKYSDLLVRMYRKVKEIPE